MSRSLTPQNPLTTNTISVSSSAGFGAGDLVYQKSGDFGVIPNGVVASATFPITATVGNNGGISPSTTYAVSVALPDSGSSQTTPIAAKLTNGNIVVVYSGTTSSVAYFRIITENNVEVVAQTSMGSSSSTPFIVVTALTGGGFAAVWNNSSANPVYAIYNNSGVVVTAATADTGVTISNSALGIASRPDGSWVLVVNDGTTSNARFKVYSALGVQVIAWTNIVGFNASLARSAVAVRSDNSFVIGVYTTSTNIQYYLYNSAGSSTGNATLISSQSATSSNGHLDMTTLTNDSIVFAYHSATAGNLPVVRILNSSNSFILDNALSGAGYTTSVKSLASGGYVVAWDSTSYRYGYYQFFNATGSATSGAVRINYGIGFSGTANNGSYYATMVETTSNVAFISCTAKYATTMTQVSKSTFLTVPFTSSSLVVGAVSNPVNAYARSGSTPNAAAFLASTSATITQSYAASGTGFTLSPVLLESTTCNSTHTRVMPNGDIVTVVSFQTTPFAIKVFVYSAIGVFKRSFTVANHANNNGFSKVCVLTDGTFVVVYNNSATALTAAFYNSSYTLTSTVSLVTDSNSFSSWNAYAFDVSAMTGAKFVLGYTTSGSGPVFKVFTNTGSAYGSAIAPATNAYSSVAVAGTAYGGFVVRYQQNASSMLFAWYANTTGTTFAQQTNTSRAGSSGNSYGMGMVSAPNGAVYTAFTDTASGGNVITQDGSSLAASVAGFNLTTGSYNTSAFTLMPNGSVAVIVLDSGAGTPYQWGIFGPVSGAFNSWASSGSLSFPGSTTPASNTSSAGSGGGPSPSLCALYDDQLVCSYYNTGTYYPYLMIVNATASSYSTSIVSGTTVSNATFLPSQSNGYIFKGVATTTATAGGSGIVQNVGSAQLNSQYPSGTSYQAFDSTGTLIEGTKGTIVGRNVNMTGVA